MQVQSGSARFCFLVSV